MLSTAEGITTCPVLKRLKTHRHKERRMTEDGTNDKSNKSDVATSITSPNMIITMQRLLSGSPTGYTYDTQLDDIMPLSIQSREEQAMRKQLIYVCGQHKLLRKQRKVEKMMDVMPDKCKLLFQKIKGNRCNRCKAKRKRLIELCEKHYPLRKQMMKRRQELVNAKLKNPYLAPKKLVRDDRSYWETCIDDGVLRHQNEEIERYMASVELPQPTSVVKEEGLM